MRISQTPDSAARQRQEWLDIAHGLYHALIAQDPNRVITLCDGEGRVVAYHYARPEQVVEIAKAVHPDLSTRS
jgi:hypothetical protein